MTIYIAGKITGDPNYKVKFLRRAEGIKNAGHKAINPTTLPAGMPWEACMRICFAMIDAADAAVFLPDWKESRGARAEKTYCDVTGKPTFEIGKGDEM